MDDYVRLAQQAVESYVSYGGIIDLPEGMPEEMLDRKAGVFVTIRRGSALRGCMGTYRPTRGNIAEEIVACAILACSKDYRFQTITEEELPLLRYEVSILSKPKRVEDLAQHDVKKEGIIVQTEDGKRGLLLPDVEGVTTTEQQVQTACKKGGIDPHDEDIQLYSFETEKHE